MMAEQNVQFKDLLKLIALALHSRDKIFKLSHYGMTRQCSYLVCFFRKYDAHNSFTPTDCFAKSYLAIKPARTA